MTTIPRSMRTLVALIALVCGVLVSSTVSAKPAADTAVDSAIEEIFPFTIYQNELANGLRVIVVPMDSPGLVGYRMAIRTGARDEYEPGRTGFAHFFEHMMFRGTKKYPAEVYNRLITEMGADTNAYTSDDVTVYLLNIAAEDLEKVMEVESDRFQNLHYPLQVFQTEAGAVYGEYRKNRMSPFFATFEALRKAAFTVHTYGHTAMGYEEDIKEMPKMFDYSRTFFDRYYRPENAILVVAGDVEPARVFELAKTYYGPWERGYVPPKVKPEPPQMEERRIEVPYQGRTLPMIAIGYKGDAYNPDDRVYAASLVLAQLAFGKSSDLYRRLVLQEQVVQTLRVMPAMGRDPALWTITAMVKDPSKVDYVLDAIDQTVAQFRESAPDAARLAAIKSHMRYEFLMRLDSPASVAGTIAHLSGVSGGVEKVAGLYRSLTQVTPADVRAAANKYLDNKRRTVAFLREK